MTWLILVGLLGLTFVLYLPPYRHSFMSDDFKHIEYIFPFINSPLQAYRVISPFWIRWYYRPVEHLAFLAGCLAFGFKPVWYYLSLSLLHALNVVFVYIVARKLGVGGFGSLCAAALFAINGRHQNVVGWISSVAIATAALGALACVASYLTFLKDRSKTIILVATFAFWLFALLSREENLILPLVLVALRFLYVRRSRPGRWEGIAGVFTLLTMAVYTAFQNVRPTWVANPHSFSVVELSHNILHQQLSQTLITLLARWTLFDPAPLLQWRGGWITFSAMSVALCLAVWFLKGGRAVRSGLLWSGCYLVFLYLAIWYRDPAQVMADRYLYLPWIGIAIAAGASLNKLSLIMTPDIRLGRAVVVGGLCTFLLIHAGYVRQYQNAWLNAAHIYQAVETQLKALVPNPSANAHFFAYQLPLDEQESDRIQAMASVWYNHLFPWPGGSLGRLKQMGKATDAVYLLRFQDDTLVNLMPELQDQRGTLFLWSQLFSAEQLTADGQSIPLDPGAFGADRVAGPANALRLTTFVQAPAATHDWASLVYTVTIPAGSTLRTAILKDAGGLAGEDGMIFRVRVQKPTGEVKEIYNEFLQPNLPGMADGWQEVSAPMQDYWNQTVQIRLEVSAGENALHDFGYWADPRLVRDTPF